MGRRVLVCGGRDFDDRDLVFRVLDAAHAAEPIEVIVHGGARGADALADDWAKSRGVSVAVFRADWKSYGRGAGPTRNQVMLDEGRPDIGFSFPGGKGTADMRRRMIKAGKVCIAVNPPSAP